MTDIHRRLLEEDGECPGRSLLSPLQRSPSSYFTDRFSRSSPPTFIAVSGRTILIQGQPVKLAVEPVLRLLALGVSLTIAIVAGARHGADRDWRSDRPVACAIEYRPRTMAQHRVAS
jgi:hypothetical protein